VASRYLLCHATRVVPVASTIATPVLLAAMTAILASNGLKRRIEL
jgi:hypothetical protein